MCHGILVRRLVILGCVLAVAACSTSPRATPPSGSPTPLATTVPVPTDADVVFAELVAFVEEARGFAFEEPPSLRIVGPGEAAFVEEWEAEEWRRINESRYRGLGILGPNDPPDPCLADGSGCDAVGYYDPGLDEMVVSTAAAEWGPAVRSVIVHELVHAVQQRRGDLNRLDKIWWRDYEAADAMEAITEGEASLVENLYLDSLPPRARWLAWEESSGLGTLEPADVVPYFDYLAYYPYDEGTRAVTAAYESGGWEAVDELLTDPPATTEALEYPAAPTSANAALVAMPTLDVDGFELVEAERWGKNDFDAYLLNTLPLDQPTGWGDDRFEVHWDGTTAVSVHVVRGDDAAATNRLADALLDHCQATDLGEGFALLRNGPDVAFVASLDVAATESFRLQLVEHGFTTAGAC